MGNIENRMKRKVLEQFEIQKDKMDLSQKIDGDGYGFEIIRENGKLLKYDGTINEFVRNN